MKKKMFKEGDTAKDFEFKKEEQHEFSNIYIIPIIGIFFLPYLFFSSRVSMIGKFTAFVFNFCLTGLLFYLLMFYTAFCNGK